MKTSLFHSGSQYIQKVISKLQSQTPSIQQIIHKTPEINEDMFIHLTDGVSWEKIQHGGLKSSHDFYFKKGICFCQPKNYASWQEIIEPRDGANMLQELFTRVSKKNTQDKIIAIGINPDEFHRRNFRIRNQEEYIGFHSSETRILASDRAFKFGKKYFKSKKARSIFYDMCIRLAVFKKSPKVAKDIIKCEPLSALGSNGAYEIIYKTRKNNGIIPVSHLTKIGEVNLKEVQKSPNFDSKKPIQSYFSVLFKDTPFEEDIKKLNC